MARRDAEARRRAELREGRARRRAERCAAWMRALDRLGLAVEPEHEAFEDMALRYVTAYLTAAQLGRACPVVPERIGLAWGALLVREADGAYAAVQEFEQVNRDAGPGGHVLYSFEPSPADLPDGGADVVPLSKARVRRRRREEGGAA